MNLTPSKTCGFLRLEQVYGLLSLTAKSVVDIVPFNPIPATVPVAAPSPHQPAVDCFAGGRGFCSPVSGELAGDFAEVAGLRGLTE